MCPAHPGRAGRLPHVLEKLGTGEVAPSRSEGFIWSGDQAGMAPFQGNDSPLAEAVAALAGEGPVRLYKEKLNYKLAGGGGYRAHQDGYTELNVGREPSVPTPPEPPPPQALNAAAAICRYTFMTQVCMIALDDFTLENGCPEVAPGDPDSFTPFRPYLSHFSS